MNVKYEAYASISYELVTIKQIKIITIHNIADIKI